jgi:hypothetical protein
MKLAALPFTLTVSFSVLLERSPVSPLSVVVRSAVYVPSLSGNVVVLPEVVAGIEFGEFRGAIALSDGL